MALPPVPEKVLPLMVKGEAGELPRARARRKSDWLAKVLLVTVRAEGFPT